MRRRDFVAASAASLPMFVPSTVFGANDRLQIGFVGLGGRACWLLQHEKFPGADIVAMADCWRPQCDRAAALLPNGGAIKKYHDYRQMFDKEKLDAVFVETTTHARVLVMMHALQAGLDVYGEKPLTLTVDEGRTLVDAVKATNRVLQTGTQQRSMPINAWASKRIREGVIGKVKEVITCNFLPPAGWYAKPAQKAPDGMNWDQWCNQCEVRPYHEQLRSRWAWYWDYDGGGQSWGVTGWGTHSLDQVQDALGASHTGPVEFEPAGWQSTSKVFARYANGAVLKMVGPERDHADLGAIFAGEQGTIEIKRGSVTATSPELLEGSPDITPEGPGENRFHIANFFDCVRSRKQPNADVETGHRSTSLCHLINMTRDLGRKLEWDPERERFANDDQANSLLARPRRKGYELPRIS